MKLIFFLYLGFYVLDMNIFKSQILAYDRNIFKEFWNISVSKS